MGSDQVIHDCVIIGSGPAGHAAAIYTSRALLNTVMYEGLGAGGYPPGGQLTATSEVENYPGVSIDTLGPDLVDNMRKQSLIHGTQIITKNISKVDFSSKPLKLWAEGEENNCILSKTVIIATGASANRLRVKGEETYWQQGISACAICDGALPYFRNKVIAVIGGGDSAAEEATYLTKYASKVLMFVRRDELRASKTMALRAQKNPKIEIIYNKTVEEILGDGENINAIIVKDRLTNQTSKVDVVGVFYAIGHTPNTEIFKNQVELDSQNFIAIRDKSATNLRASLTSVDGVFAAGDVRDRLYKQAITAAGSGCQAALDCITYLEEMKDKEMS